MKTINLINHLLKISVENKDNELPQMVDKAVAIKCWYILAQMSLQTEDDILFYLLCMSLINGYIKQRDDVIHLIKNEYIFKQGCSSRILQLLNKSTFKNIKVSYNPKEKFNDKVIFFSFGSLQFSFHGINRRLLQMIPPRYFNLQVFNEIQNKKCSQTLFNEFLSHTENFTNKTISNLNLMGEAEKFCKQVLSSSKRSNKELLWETIVKPLSNDNKLIEVLADEYDWPNEYEKNDWEWFGPSGTQEQTKIFPHYIKYLDGQKVSKGSLENMIFTISEEWEKQNPSQFANVLNMIYKNGGSYSQDANLCNTFVKIDLTNDQWEKVDCPRLKIVNELIENGKIINIIKRDELFNLLNTNQLDLVRMGYPPSNWMVDVKNKNPINKPDNISKKQKAGSNNPFDRLDKILFNKGDKNEKQ